MKRIFCKLFCEFAFLCSHFLNKKQKLYNLFPEFILDDLVLETWFCLWVMEICIYSSVKEFSPWCDSSIFRNIFGKFLKKKSGAFGHQQIFVEVTKMFQNRQMHFISLVLDWNKPSFFTIILNSYMYSAYRRWLRKQNKFLK